MQRIICERGKKDPLQSMNVKPFHGIYEFVEYTNFLFRTDPAQLWSNAATKYNLYFLQRRGRWSEYTCKSFEERESMCNYVRGIVQLLAKRQKCDLASFLPNVLMLHADYSSLSMYRISKRIEEDAVEAISNIEQDPHDFSAFLYVVHGDHLHEFSQLHGIAIHASSSC